ncbi:BglG family transcription antiterminator [Falseniella ignava]|uniref:Ascorbate-specific PTS system EIIA component n=1 Tax=Falseniella ignava CCUG 37419 TaxID=883112 RepID=K1LGM3_9LACT|nr:PTS sugar transporter subunit IIA [Falseniella ignava]EKB55775.1 hypothetical protein HMPREF9707_00962 [Falseniella ignava CCUG 37419]
MTNQIYNADQRQKMIYLMLFVKENNSSLFHIQDVLEVSKNTIINDMNNLKNNLRKAGSQTQIVYSRKEGYRLKGNAVQVRSEVFDCIDKLLHEISIDIIIQNIVDEDVVFLSNFREMFKKITCEITVVPSRRDRVFLFLYCLFLHLDRNGIGLDSSNQSKFSVSNKIQQIVTELLINIDRAYEDIEKEYIAGVLLTMSNNQFLMEDFPTISNVAREIVKEVERISAVRFEEREKLISDLYNHLIPAYYRIVLELKFENTLLNKIKNEYLEMFNIVSLGLKPLKQFIDCDIPEDEVGFLTLLFVGYSKRKRIVDTLNAIVVCPNGFSSSLIMKSTLIQLFPNINFIATHNHELTESMIIENRIDAIFSNVPINLGVKNYVVSPLMSELEKRELYNNIQNDFFFKNQGTLLIEQVIDSVMPYIVIKDNLTRGDLINRVTEQLSLEKESRGDDKPMLTDLLTTDKIVIVDQEMDWEQSIASAANPLLEKEFITQEYIQSMIDVVKEMGPYIVLAPQVALAHSRPENGVKELGISLLINKKPIDYNEASQEEFDEDRLVQLVFVLAAIDNETHLTALIQLSQIMDDESTVAKLLEASNSEEALKIITKKLKEEGND